MTKPVFKPGIKPGIKIVTWNVNSVTARCERVLRFLERESPDILCLQELKCLEEKFPFEAIKPLGYEAAVFGQKTYNGVAILSKARPFDQVEKGFNDGDADVAARCIVVRVGTLQVVNVYVPNGQELGSEKYAYKLKWLERCLTFLKPRMTEHTVLVGDFNIAPDERDVHDADLWRESVLCSKAVRDYLRQICALGLVDIYRLREPKGNNFSWWDYRNLSFPKNNGLRLDLILGTSGIVSLTSQVRFDRDERKGEKPSDHIPVILELTKFP